MNTIPKSTQNSGQTQPTLSDTKSEIQERPDFYLKLTSNKFAPRARSGDTLMMRRGCLAEDGDLVAVDVSWQFGEEPGTAIRVEQYRTELEYYAVCVAIINFGQQA